MSAFNTDFATTALALNLITGAIAAVLIYRLALPRVGPLGASGLVGLTCCWVSAPVMLLAYSESMSLALLAGALLAIDRRRPWMATFLVTALALTRLVTPALALVALVVHVVAWRRHGKPVSTAERAGVAALAATSLLGVFAWSALSSAVGAVGAQDRAVTMATGWSGGWFGQFWDIHPFAALFPAAVCVFALRVAWSERQEWGPTMASWVGAYALLLVFLTPLQIGIIRYSLLAFPLGLVIVGKRGGSVRLQVLRIALTCLVGVVAQAVWIRYSIVVDSTSGPLIGP